MIKRLERTVIKSEYNAEQTKKKRPHLVRNAAFWMIIDSIYQEL